MTTKIFKKPRLPHEITTRIHRRQTVHHFTRDLGEEYQQDDSWLQQMNAEQEHRLQEGQQHD